MYSHLLNILGQTNEAMPWIERAIELDPLNDNYRVLHAVDLAFARRYDDAIAEFEAVIETSPRHPVAGRLSDTLHAKGMYEEAFDAEVSYVRALGDTEGVEALTRGFQEGGYREAMRRWAETAAARALATRTRALRVAVLYVRAGENDLGLDWLDRAFEYHDPNMPYIGVVPTFDSLRGDPRFQDLLRRMNLPTTATGSDRDEQR